MSYNPQCTGTPDLQSHNVHNPFIIAMPLHDAHDCREERSVTFGEPVILAPPALNAEDSNLEPKKKGRFTVIENNSAAVPAAAVAMQLTDPLRDSLRMEPAGKQPAALGAVLAPKLQELMDHAALQQAALQKLVVLVHECERTGKLQPALRIPLFAELAEAEGVDGLRAALEQVQQRLAEVESENVRLRERNAQLEAMAAE